MCVIAGLIRCTRFDSSTHCLYSSVHGPLVLSEAHLTCASAGVLVAIGAVHLRVHLSVRVQQETSIGLELKC